jgi:hypothetical protein
MSRSLSMASLFGAPSLPVAPPSPEAPPPSPPSVAPSPEERLHSVGARFLPTTAPAATDDRTALLARLSTSGRDLRLCSAALRDDREVVMVAVANHGGKDGLLT